MLLEFEQIYDYVGHVGLFHVLVFPAILIFSITHGIQVTLLNFMGPDQDHWCQIPRLENFSAALQKRIAIPYEEDNEAYSQCRHYDVNFSNYTDEELVAWNWTAWEGQVETRECSSWVYDFSIFSNTMRSEWGLVCDMSFWIPMMVTLAQVVALAANPIAGILADRFGRKRLASTALMVACAFYVASAFSPNFPLFAVARSIGTGLNPSITNVGFVLVTEMFGSKYRFAAGILYIAGIDIGMTLLPVLAYFIRDFRFLQIAAMVISAFGIFQFCIMPESPRWLNSHGRTPEAEEVFKRMARYNKKSLPEKFELLPSISEGDDTNGKESISDIIKYPSLMIRLVLMFCVWTSSSVVYYGLSLSTGNLPGDVYFNSIITPAVGFMGSVCSIFVVTRFSRKIVALMIPFTCVGLVNFATIPLLHVSGMEWLQILLAMIGKFFACVMNVGCIVYMKELFPTTVSSAVFGICGIGSALGTMAAGFAGDYMQDIWQPLPNVMFGVFSFGSVVCVSLLPDTKDEPATDTLAQAVLIGQRGRQMTAKEGAINQAFESERTRTESWNSNIIYNTQALPVQLPVGGSLQPAAVIPMSAFTTADIHMGTPHANVPSCHSTTIVNPGFVGSFSNCDTTSQVIPYCVGCVSNAGAHYQNAQNMLSECDTYGQPPQYSQDVAIEPKGPVVSVQQAGKSNGTESTQL